MLDRLATFFYGASLLTLPWVGVGVLKLSTGRDWGGGLQPAWLFMALAVLTVGAACLRRGSVLPAAVKEMTTRTRRWLLLGTAAVLVCILASAAGLWLAPSGESAEAIWGRFVKQAVQLAIMAFFVIWPALWTRGVERWKWTVKILLLGGLVQVAYGFLQGVAYYHPLPGFEWLDKIFTSNPSILSGSTDLYLDDSFRHVPRLRGTVCEPLYLGNYLLFLLPLVVVPVWTARTRRLMAAVFLMLLLWTWSRGAWLGFVGQAVLAGGLILNLGPVAGRLGLTNPNNRRVKSIIFGMVTLLVVVPVAGWVFGWEELLFPYRRLVQTFSGQDWSNLTRLYSMQAAWRAFLLSPVVGIGWGQFGWHFPALVDPMGLQSQFSWPVVNNFPLLVLCETGLLGFLVFSGWVVGLARWVYSAWTFLVRSGRGTGTFSLPGNLLFATSLAVVGVWTQMLTFSQYNLPHIWVALGLLLAILAEGNRDAWPDSAPVGGEGGP